MGQHARWKTSKLNRPVYGEKVCTELTGKDGKPIETKATVQIYMPDNRRWQIPSLDSRGEYQ
jgi:hypothetical protein